MIRNALRRQSRRMVAPAQNSCGCFKWVATQNHSSELVGISIGSRVVRFQCTFLHFRSRHKEQRQSKPDKITLFFAFCCLNPARHIPEYYALLCSTHIPRCTWVRHAALPYPVQSEAASCSTLSVHIRHHTQQLNIAAAALFWFAPHKRNSRSGLFHTGCIMH